MRQIIIDTETTGLSTDEGHRIIEIGAVEMINRRLTGNHFHYYINPQRDIDEGALQVHGITQEFLADKPLFAEIAEKFLAYIQDAELVIHNAAFDTGFLNVELQKISKNYPFLQDQCRIIDTLMLARQRHPGQRNSLDALCKRYNVDNSTRELHGALLDAQLLARVYLAMTGGQATLFGDELSAQTVIPSQAQQEKRKQKKRPPLIILKATAEEEAAHLTRMQEIEKSVH